jgi:hypothetical protein
MGVDYEERVDFTRLRDYRLGRVKAAASARSSASSGSHGRSGAAR